MISEYSKNKIKAVPIYRFFPNATNLGRKYVCKCPNPSCDSEYNTKKKKGGFNINIDRNFGKCFKCGLVLSGAINTYAYLNNLDQKKDFPRILKEIAEKENIEIEEDEREARQEILGKPIPGSFAYKQLEESGLNVKDITAEVYEDGKIVKVPVFQKGAINTITGEIDYSANEMIILYYDLEGNRRKFMPIGARSSKSEKPYTRVRWSNPDAHLSKDGKPIKYQTPTKAKAEIYIPQVIRDLYKRGEEFDTLILQEGEKKAEKSCKHGIYSVGIQGIFGTGKKDEGLPMEIQYIAEKCKVKNIVLLFDSDWQDISKNIDPEDDDVDKRPKQFAKAAIKFRRFVKTLHQAKIHVDVWFGHINKNEAEAKGIDDLLCTILKGKEESLKDDIADAMIDVKGEGKYVSIYNISTKSETQILDYWNLNSNRDFFEAHKEKLLTLKSFKFDKVFYNVVGTEIKQASEFGTGKEFWDVEYDPETGKKKIKMSIIEVKAFLEANGYCSYVDEENNNIYVKIDKGIIQRKKVADIHRYVFNYVSKAAKDKDILEYFALNMEKMLSQSKLNLLNPLITTAGIPEQYVQRFYYKNSQIAITENGIDIEILRGPVWEDNLINRDFERVRIFENINKNSDGDFEIDVTHDGMECEFLRYLINTSSFKEDNDTQELLDLNHLINKITCLGYLLRSYKSFVETKVVVGMDTRLSEVGESNGRSGKSIIGLGLKNMVKQTFIGGRELEDSDNFVLSEVRRNTDNVFIDDVKVNFNIAKLYSSITGDMMVNVKGGKRFTIPFEEAPKIYLTTNHAMKSEGESSDDRMIFMGFSTHYNSENTPRKEFGHMLFAEWDERQWTLFDNLMIECVYWYMKSIQNGWSKIGCGAIQPPMRQLIMRKERQNMGEAFFQWAEAYFSPEGDKLNTRLIRSEIFNKFHEDVKGQLKFVTPTSFGKKIKSFCEYFKLHFNPHKKHSKTGQTFQDWIKENPDGVFYGAEDKSGGVEYFTIADSRFFNADGMQANRLIF